MAAPGRTSDRQWARAVNARAKSTLRLIGGRWRRRNLEFLDLPAIRPTPNRVRETLFGWLAPGIEGAACLDLFAGSGVLGFEAVSRGAAAATLVESERRICAQIASEIARFGAGAIKVVTADAQAFVRRARTAYDVVFLDPPFGAGLAQKTLTALADNARILAPTALIYVEWEAKTEITPPAGLDVLRIKRASEVQYALLGRQRASARDAPLSRP